MANIKISQLTAKGSPIAATDLLEIAESNGAGGYVAKSVTGANILSSKQDTLVSGTNIKTVEGQNILGAGNIDITKTDVGLANVDNTSDLNKPISTATQAALNAKQNTITNSDSITQGTTNLFLTTAERTKLTNTSGTNTGDNATNTQYSSLVSNATHTGDATGNVGLTVVGINNTILSTLTTGILKNTTTTGVPSIAVAADFPILNQNTTGSAGSTATLTTGRTISMDGDVLYTSPAFNGSANVLGTATLASVGTAGTYTKVTTDAKGRVTVGANITSADVPTLNQNTTGTSANVTGIVAVANGGTGTATPSLVAGTNVTITGTFPNQTINSSGGGGGGGTEIGALIGGGIVVGVFVEGGVNKALVASLTNLSTSLPYTIPAFQTTLIGGSAQSMFNGLTNTNAIIAQTGLPATTLYAAGIARLFAGGSFSDWYLPSLWELNMVYDSAGIVNKILGANGFVQTFYWSSTEAGGSIASRIDFNNNTQNNSNKSTNFYVRAVRIHTI
jgi:hypothetical protein